MHWHLLLDGEAVYSLVGHPLLLLLARVVLLQASSRRSSLQVGLRTELVVRRWSGVPTPQLSL